MKVQRATITLTGLVAFMAVPSQVLARTLGQGSDADIPWVRLTAALLLCLALAAGAAWALSRRLEKSGASLHSPFLEKLQRLTPGAVTPRPIRRFTDVDTIHPSAGLTVSVFKCDGHSFMATATAQGQIVLVSLDAQAEDQEAPQ